jgi:hypothetical protein
LKTIDHSQGGAGRFSGSCDLEGRINLSVDAADPTEHARVGAAADRHENTPTLMMK